MTYPSEDNEDDKKHKDALIVMGDLPRWEWIHGMKYRARKRIVLIYGRGLKNALGYEENWVEKRIILIDGSRVGKTHSTIKGK